MSLPPEQINIKRRREDEPVDTLYIQSELHQTKRRFTDFVFQRVQIKGNHKSSPSPSPSHPLAPAQRVIRTPRSVSTSNFSSFIPRVRATSPGAEFRDERRRALARKENEEKLKKALHSSPAPELQPKTEPDAPHDAKNKQQGPAASSGTATTGSATPGAASSASSRCDSPASSVRRFQISRPSTPLGALRGSGRGVQKRKGDNVAVLVEQLKQRPHSRQASMVADAAARAEESGSVRVPSSLSNSITGETPAPRPRKRPVVNKAEREWREQRKTAISAAKDHISQTFEKQAQSQSKWDDESERLAKEFEQIALDFDSEIDPLPSEPQPAVPSVQTTVRDQSLMPKPPLKYPPRVPNKPRSAVTTQGPQEVKSDIPPPQVDAEQEKVDESDGDYVYDTYIRRPLPDTGLLTNPVTDLEQDQEAWLQQNGIDTTRPDIGVIVITHEDESWWEHFAEDDDDEDRWDSEDGDSNAENNPANDYPDEDLSWDDEEDNAAAIYGKYRYNAGSDDEEFGFGESGSEGDGVGLSFRARDRSHANESSEEDDW